LAQKVFFSLVCYRVEQKRDHVRRTSFSIVDVPLLALATRSGSTE